MVVIFLVSMLPQQVKSTFWNVLDLVNQLAPDKENKQYKLNMSMLNYLLTPNLLQTIKKPNQIN